MATQIAPGEVFRFTNTTGSAIPSGAVVILGNKFGVALADIADTETGSVQICGVFAVPKATGAITQGAKLYWDAAVAKVTTSSNSGANAYFGDAYTAAASGDATAEVLLNGLC